MVRVRFAPSPTGELHVGGLRTALYNYLFAKKQGGSFLLRIEDTDRSRYVEGAVERLTDLLNWAGVKPDEGANIGGNLGPYVQSQRLEIYQDYAQKLIESGHAYYCFATPDELEAMREEAGPYGGGYNGMYRDYPREEAKKRVQSGEPYVIRLKIPSDRNFVVDDIVRGTVSIASETVDDQVLLKSDGFPTYHLAAVVDDHFMEITHVIRGEEWLTSTPKHLYLYECFGWEPPLFAHLSLLVNEQKKKLSKRDGDVSVAAYREKGFAPFALVNFLALLGWNAGDDKELYDSMEELTEAFSLERIHKSPAVFDFDKLLHINSYHLRRLTPAEGGSQLGCWSGHDKDTDANYLAKVFELMKDRCQTIAEMADSSRYFFEDPVDYDEKTVAKRWKDDSPVLLDIYQQRLEALSDWSQDKIEDELRKVVAEHEVGAGRLIHPTRLAVSGVGGGPSLFAMLEVLGKETVVRRMKTALQKLGGRAC